MAQTAEQKREYRREYYWLHREQCLAQSAKWYQEHKAAVRVYNQRRYSAQIEQAREQSRQWHRAHREYCRQRSRQIQIKIRDQALAIYGGRCDRCGESTPCCLHFHHVVPIRADARERDRMHESGWPLRRKIIRAGQRLPQYRLLCANCHEKEHDRLQRVTEQAGCSGVAAEPTVKSKESHHVRARPV